MIPITKPYLGEEEAQAAVIRSGWVTQGPKVAEFERVVAEYCQTAHAVAVSSCTTALHLALLTLGIGPGDEVICPSMSFIVTANSVRYTRATPVFADVDPQTYGGATSFFELVGEWEAGRRETEETIAATLDGFLLLYSFAVMVAVLLIGIIIFNQIERTFMDTV